MNEIDYYWKEENDKPQVPWPIKGFKLIKIDRVEEISPYTVGNYKTLKAVFTVERTS